MATQENSKTDHDICIQRNTKSCSSKMVNLEMSTMDQLTLKNINQKFIFKHQNRSHMELRMKSVEHSAFLYISKVTYHFQVS